MRKLMAVSLALLFFGCTHAFAPDLQPQPSSLYRDDLRVWANGSVTFTFGEIGKFTIHRDRVPELKELILKADKWAEIAKKEKPCEFEKDLGSIGTVSFRFCDRGLGGLCDIRVNGVNWPYSVFHSLLPRLDRIPEMEADLKRLDAAFK